MTSCLRCGAASGCHCTPHGERSPLADTLPPAPPERPTQPCGELGVDDGPATERSPAPSTSAPSTSVPPTPRVPHLSLPELAALSPLTAPWPDEVPTAVEGPRSRTPLPSR